MKYLPFLFLPLFWSCVKQTPTNDYQNTPIGLEHLYDTATGCFSGPFGYPNPGGKIPNPNAIGISAFEKPIVHNQATKKLSMKEDPVGHVEDSEFYDYSSSIGIVESEDSSSIKFVGYTGVTFCESGISNRYFLDTIVIEKPVVVIVHDTLNTSHLEFYPAQVTYINRYYVRGYYYNYDSSLTYHPVDTSLINTRVYLVDGLVKPSNLFIVE